MQLTSTLGQLNYTFQSVGPDFKPERKQMALGNNDVKKNLCEHSEAKVKLLGKYLKRYLGIISNNNYTEIIHIHDLFCGPGVYQNGGEGSPIVALKQVKEAYFSIINQKADKLPKINCYFNDSDAEKIKILKEKVVEKKLHFDEIGQLTFSTEEYQTEILKLVEKFKKIKNEKAFVFIDPYGYKDIKSEHIKLLMDCSNKVEVLLWLPTQHMYRFSENGTPEALSLFIEELTEYKTWNANDDVWKFVEQLKLGFQKYIGESYYVDKFTIRKDKNTVFCLYFFTSHIKGFEKMLEAKWEIDTENGRGWEFSTDTLNLFANSKNTNPLEKKLHEFLKANSRTNWEIYEFTLKNGYLPKHANQILEEWQKKARLIITERNGKPARKKSFYIKYYKPTDVDRQKVKIILR